LGRSRRKHRFEPHQHGFGAAQELFEFIHVVIGANQER
jgi:hypothetical protein